MCYKSFLYTIFFILFCSAVVFADPGETELFFHSDSLIKRTENKSKWKFTWNDSWTSPDKVHHMLVSAMLMTSAFYLAHEHERISDRDAVLLSSSFAISFGLGKEIFDNYTKNGVASYKDLVSDMLGIGIGYILFVKD